MVFDIETYQRLAPHARSWRIRPKMHPGVNYYDCLAEARSRELSQTLSISPIHGTPVDKLQDNLLVRGSFPAHNADEFVRGSAHPSAMILSERVTRVMMRRFPNCSASRNLSEQEIHESLAKFFSSPTSNWWLGLISFFVHPAPNSLIETIRIVEMLEREGIHLDYYHGTVASSDPLQRKSWWTNNYNYALAHATTGSHSADTQSHGVTVHTIPTRRVLMQIAHAPETVFLPSGDRNDGIPPLTIQINFGLVDELSRGFFAQSAKSSTVPCD